MDMVTQWQWQASFSLQTQTGPLISSYESRTEWADCETLTHSASRLMSELASARRNGATKEEHVRNSGEKGAYRWGEGWGIKNKRSTGGNIKTGWRCGRQYREAGNNWKKGMIWRRRRRGNAMEKQPVCVEKECRADAELAVTHLLLAPRLMSIADRSKGLCAR